MIEAQYSLMTKNQSKNVISSPCCIFLGDLGSPLTSKLMIDGKGDPLGKEESLDDILSS